MEYILKTNSLEKRYKDFAALNGLTMSVPKGSIYGFVGKNGAVDYMTKPFDIQELLARIEVQLRKPADADKNVLRFGNISLDQDTRMVECNGSEIRLTRTEYAILRLLMLRPGQVVAKLTILEDISIDTPDCTEDSLKIHIHNLRRKLKAASGKDHISAVWGIGFMLTDAS